jgi:hypothetical protein
MKEIIAPITQKKMSAYDLSIIKHSIEDLVSNKKSIPMRMNQQQ